MSIHKDQIEHARTSWGEAIVEISGAYETGGIERARSTAQDAIEQLYGFEFGPILFKPTLSGGAQTFRNDKDGALSYFVGHNGDYPSDSGFGIKYWRKVEFETSASFTDGNVAMWMGWVTFTDKDDNVVKVDKSFGYKKDLSGNLKIVLHHSSLPFQP